MEPYKIKLAHRMRKEGFSIRAITKELSCSRNSVTRWVQDMPLDDLLIQKIKDKGDLTRALAANHPNSPKNKWMIYREQVSLKSEQEMPKAMSNEMLKIIGIALYWAEGTKAGRNRVAFSNSDPAMINIIMKFFRNICCVKDEKFRGELNIHPHLDAKKAEFFWSKVSKIPLNQFYKTQKVVSRASSRKRDTLPVGTFKVSIDDTELFCKIKGWIKGLAKSGG